MQAIRIRPDYRALGLGAVAAIGIMIAIAGMAFHLSARPPSVALLAGQVMLVTLFVFSATAALRLIMNLCFKDVALQIDDDGVYLEGVTRYPIAWDDIASVRDQGRFVVFRTTDKRAVIQFALFRASFGRTGWRSLQDVIISAGLLDAPAGVVREAIESRITHAKARA